LAFLGWAGLRNPVLLLAGVFLLGVGFAINAPAWASLVPQVVTDKELPSALTLNGVQFNITSILGPALAGLLLTRVGAPVVFALNAVAFLLVFTAIPSLGKTGSAMSQTLVSFLRSIPSTFRYVGQAQNVGNILARNAIFSFFVVVIPALAPVLLLKELRLDASSLGLVFASMGVGSVISALMMVLSQGAMTFGGVVWGWSRS
jgi:MFS family permease